MGNTAGARNSDPKVIMPAVQRCTPYSRTLQECQTILDVFFDLGHRELDTARVYCAGTTEELLGTLDLRDATLDTKVYPVSPGGHEPKALRATFMESLKALKRDKVRVLYLHAPDRQIPFADTCAEMDKMYKEGLLYTFGLSNFAAWEVAEVVGICRANGWVQPTIYQVMYNAITRAMEPELVPCCRKLGLRIVAYNPLAGGFFAGKISSTSDTGGAGGRFDPNSPSGSMYRARYVNEGYVNALAFLKDLAAKHNFTLIEIALRWMQHHSKLTPEDGVILGASSAAQLEENCKASEKGPLPEEVVAALDEAHRIVLRHGGEPTYWR
ncbi:NADP-dependent oxidoreductase domain-containing protein [Schizophyllum amplum]|uniref:NADP-dependent oxidoreductase domain-containing protein n=1 Tax=Schizophyllum amplum TaxID=97359 RepID=A0A550BZR5_9AGAR|nr:NADP-dependent oxidoreductase domain-containing protein [Auriculariopsis ampla]